MVQGLLTEEPMAHIATRNWSERAAIGDKTAQLPITVFSNYGEIKLLVNNKEEYTSKVDTGTALLEVKLKEGNNLLAVYGKTKGGDWSLEDYTRVDVRLLPENLQESTPKTIAINCGTFVEYHDPQTDLIYRPDQVYQKGSYGYTKGEFLFTYSRIGTTAEIEGTIQDPIYQTALEKLEGYRVDVEDGRYEVLMKFAEINREDLQALINDIGIEADKNGEKKGQRVFSISINGEEVLTRLNLEDLVGKQAAADFKWTVDVRGGQGIQIDFKALSGPGMLNALKISKLDD